MSITADIGTVRKNIEQLIIKKLAEKTGGPVYDDTVTVPLGKGFTIKVQSGKYKEHEDIFIIQLVFVVDYPDFDESLIEPVDAQGRTENECAEMAVEMFTGGVWHALMQSVKNEAPQMVSACGPDIDGTFRMYGHSVVRINSNDKYPVMLTDIIKDELPKYLGRKKYYWVRIYLAKYRDKKNVSVRINGSVCSELQKLFDDYAENRMDAEDHFVSEKQYAILVNDEDDICPFSKDTVTKAADRCIDEMRRIRSTDEYIAFSSRLTESILADLPDSLDESEKAVTAESLSSEVRIFVPEIFAKLTLGYDEGDSLILMGEEQPDGPRHDTAFKKTQLRSYFYIQQSVLRFLGTQPPREDVERITANSVAFRELGRAISAAKEKGMDIKPSDLSVSGTSYRICVDGYKVW